MKAFLKNLPDAPGVYLMKNSSGDVLYVGKAISLKKRVRSYFSPRAAREYRRAARYLSDLAEDVEFIVTGNETEAFILENNLIKKYKPAYNIRLKDDKSFLCLRVDLKHPFPSIVPVRRPKRDGRLYFGPYASATALRSTLRILRTVIPMRDCSDREFKSRKRPCIKHQIGRCTAPCSGLIDQTAYRENLERALCILRGNVDELLEQLEKEMQQASKSMEYERAASLRDKIGHLKSFARSQKVEDIKFYDVDVVGLWQSGGLAEVVVLFFREGKLISSAAYTFELPLDAEELISQFLSRFYDGGRHVPEITYIPLPIPEMDQMERHLRHLRKAAFKLRTAKRGNAAKLLKMAEENARLSLKTSQQALEQRARVLEELKKTLELERTPISIECIDISTTGGDEAVGALVHFKHGVALRGRYRRYRIRTVKGMDDYAMIEEVVRRRLRRGVKERDLPDLIMVDGGKGQLSSALKTAGEFADASVPFIGIKKGGTRARAVHVRADADDEIVLPPGRHAKGPESGTPAMHLLQQIRDEAHRFAITYHRKRRRKKGMSSPIDAVRGLGADKKQRLLSHFGGLKGLKSAVPEELSRVPGVGPVLAERIYQALHS
ncbi:MAG: excinuclease ABC subunit UvrC [Planctomycetota bacterium]